MPKLSISKQAMLTSHFRTLRSAVVLSCCSLTLGLSPVKAQERPQPKSPLWQINGIVAALENRDRDRRFPVDGNEAAFEQIVLLKQSDLQAYRQDAKIIIDAAIADLRQAKGYSRDIAQAGQVLEKFASGDPEIIKFLHDLAKSRENDGVRCLAIQSLNDQVDRQASQILIALANNTQESLKVRSCVIEAFERVGRRDRKIMRLLQNLLYNPQNHATLRAEAASALIQLGDNDPKLSQVLLNLVADPEKYSVSRYLALRTLGSLKNADPKVINALLEFIKTDSEDNLRHTALESLGKLAPADHPDVSQLVIEILKNPDESGLLLGSASEILVKLSVTQPKYQALMLDILVNRRTREDIRLGIMRGLVSNDVPENPLLIQVLSRLVQDPEEDARIRNDAVSKLGQFGKTNRKIREKMITIAKERWADGDRRARAIAALANGAESNQTDRQILLDILNDPKEDVQTRLFIAETIGSFHPLSLNQLFLFAHATHDVTLRSFDRSRFNAYFYGQGTKEVQLMMQWLGRPKILPNLRNMTDADRRKTLQIFLTVWPDSQGFEKSRGELVKAITLIISSSRWTSNDLPLLEQHYQNLNRAYFSEATIIKGVIESLR
jgi:HEAT repeat protein